MHLFLLKVSVQKHQILAPDVLSSEHLSTVSKLLGPIFNTRLNLSQETADVESQSRP